MEELLTVKEVAKTLRVHPKSVYRWVETGKIACSHAGGSIRFTEEQVETFLAQKNIPEKA